MCSLFTGIKKIHVDHFGGGFWGILGLLICKTNGLLKGQFMQK